MPLALAFFAAASRSSSTCLILSHYRKAAGRCPGIMKRPCCRPSNLSPAWATMIRLKGLY
eukprot:1435163-Pyramimonas_sp.AAC.1